MPRDNKRFINPLLRSSEEAPAAPAPVRASSPQSSPSGALEEERQVAVADVSAQPEEPADAVPVESETVVSTSEERQTSPRGTKHGDEKALVESSADEEISEPTESAQDGRDNSADGPVAVLNTPLAEDPLPYEARSHSSNGSSRRESGSSNRRNRRSNNHSESIPETPLATEEHRTRTLAPRQHGAQSFESTHERITLWIDKRLKQDFENLAYEQNLSKTRLLNEAIDELLKKYGIQ